MSGDAISVFSYGKGVKHRFGVIDGGVGQRPGGWPDLRGPSVQPADLRLARRVEVDRKPEIVGIGEIVLVPNVATL